MVLLRNLATRTSVGRGSAASLSLEGAAASEDISFVVDRFTVFLRSTSHCSRSRRGRGFKFLAEPWLDTDVVNRRGWSQQDGLP